MAVSITDVTTWPLRMTRAEVASVLRCSVRTLHSRIQAGRVPGPDQDGTWARLDIEAFVLGKNREFERLAARNSRIVSSATQRSA